MDGMTDGLPIKERGAFKFTIGDNNGRLHNILIPKSLYVSGMKTCLLSPQHWVQTAAEKKTWMGNFDDCWYGARVGGSKTLKILHFSEFLQCPKLSSGHCSNEYKRNTTTTPP